MAMKLYPAPASTKNLSGLNRSPMNYGANNPGAYGAQPGGYYGGNHPPPNPGYPGGINPEVQQWFQNVDRDRSGKITAKELQAALVNGQGKNFSDQACNLMIGMFDQDKTGTIDINEFQQLYNYINQWLGTFRSYDKDQSGFVEEAELAQAFQQMGFRFSPDFIKFLIAKSDLQNRSQISVDQFIVLCVQIQRFTETGSGVDSNLDEPKRKRKLKNDRNDLPLHSENTITTKDKISNNLEPNVETHHIIEKLKQENRSLKDDMNQLVNENVHLLKENKLLQEENNRLELKISFLHGESERLSKQHQDAIELSSWLTSARDIVETLSKKSVLFSRPPKKTLPIHHREDTQCHSAKPSMPNANMPQNVSDLKSSCYWYDGDIPNMNGKIASSGIKIEREEEQFEEGQESPYHTPLLNFDQVEFHSPGKKGCDVPSRALSDIVFTGSAEEQVDKVGREQLLFPEPVEGVCELFPGSRIYVSLTAMENIRSKKSHSSVARSCLEAIFKMPFLLSCSVQGNVAKGPYGKPDVQRPSLYRPAVECILKYARYHAERNGWKVEENTTIKKQMNTRLSELRNISKYKAQIAISESSDSEHKGYSRYKNIVATLSALPIVAKPPSSESRLDGVSRKSAPDLSKSS